VFRRVLIIPTAGLVLVAALLLPSLLMPAVPAFGHADYDRSAPAHDEIVAQVPARVDVYFTQEVFRQEGSNFVRVFDESEAQVSDGDGVVDDDDRTHISAELPAGLGSGRYIVRWKTLSDGDGDEDEGAFCFYIGVQPTAEQEAECAAFGEDAGETSPTPGAVATSTPAAAGATATQAAPADGGNNSDGGVSTALIVVAAVVGAAIVVVVVAGGAIVWFRRTLE